MAHSRDVRVLAEHNLLASLLILDEPEFVLDVSSIICPKDFHDFAYSPPMNQHSRIFIAMQTLSTFGEQINQVTVATKLYESIKESHGGDMGCRNVSDIAEMSLMMSESGTALDYLEYAKAVAQLANPKGIKRPGPSISLPLNPRR